VRKPCTLGRLLHPGRRQRPEHEPSAADRRFAAARRSGSSRRKAPETGFELLVVDRHAFALELAREWVRSGLPRSPVR